MRSPQELVHSRARLRQRYALFPLEGYPTSLLPHWPGSNVRILCAPAIGARFAMYLIDVPAGKGTSALTDDEIESFIYVRSGAIEVSHHPRDEPVLDHDVTRASRDDYVFVPTNWDGELMAIEPSQLIVVRKRYEQTPQGVQTSHPLATFVLGSMPLVEEKPFMDNPHARLKMLLPDDVGFDLAMNIFTFDPGHGLPYVETHVMEHGLLMLEGKGMYYLDGEWMEVEKDDFIWMGPYCPQSFYATGPTPAKYIYYKNVNREILL